VDKVIAAVAGMSAGLYLLSFIVAWHRVVTPRSASMFADVFLDRAVAWTALFILFVLHASVKLKLVDWSDAVVDVFLLLALIAIYAAGMVSVWQISKRRHPFRGPALFAGVTLAVGLLILLA
jgi:hypothetical protein